VEVKAGFKKTDVGLIPCDWNVEPLQTIGDPNRPISYGIVKTGPKLDTGIPCLRVVDIVEGRILEDDLIRTSPETSESYKRTKLVEGDVVLALRGKIGEAAVVPKSLVGANLTRGVALLANSPRLSSEYIKYYISSDTGRTILNGLLNGSALRELSIGTLRVVPIALPSLPEQRAIAEVLSDVDSMIARLDQLIAKKKDIKQGAMQELLTGRRRLSGFSGKWQVKKLGEIADIRKGQLITEVAVVSGDVPVIAGGKRPTYYHNRSNREGKTITVSASGANAGYVAFFDAPIFASDCSTISERPHYTIEFIYFQMLLRQDSIFKMQTGGAQPHIHAVDIKPLDIHFCELVEQSAIAAVFTDMEAEVTALERNREKANMLKQGMMQELLTGRIRLV